MGEVYLAEDTRLKRQVALKFLPGDVASDPARLARFEREAQVVAGLNHPNIVTVHAIERHGETVFIAMEYLDGQTLSEIVPRRGLPLNQLLSTATQIVDALVAAHSRGVVHRDLKPGNVMVLAGDRVKVLDFGLAKLREEPEAATLPTQELTGDGKIVGTIAYMSPEQAESKPVDERSDIFSFGVMLYEMATGERPFKGDTSLSVLSSILRDTPKAVTELNPGLPRDVWRIVRHCLAKEPDRRYQSAKDLRHDLDDLAQSLSSGELTAALASSARPSPWPMRAALAVALLGLIAAAGVWQFRDSQASADATPPTLSHTRLTQADGQERWPSLSPDGKWVVYVAQGDIHLQSVTGQTTINLTKDSPAPDTMPAFSPDGESIAFRSGRDGGGIFVMGRTGESVKRLTRNGFHPAWFPDGKTIVYAHGEGPQGPENRNVNSELWIVSVEGGEPRQLFAGDAVQPRVSPNGRRIAYWAMPAGWTSPGFSVEEPMNREIWTIDGAGANPVRVTDHEANDWNPVWSPDGRWLYFLSNRSGHMGLWRIAIDESSGVPGGHPQPMVTPAWYVGDFSLAADGSIAVYTSLTASNNVARVAFDPVTATVKGDVELVTKGTNDFAWFDVSEDGRLIAATTSSRTKEDLYVLGIADGSVRQLTNDFARDRQPFWSHDGRSIYFYSDRRGTQAWRINADGSDLQQLTKAPGAKGSQVPSPDGTRVATILQGTEHLLFYDVRDFSKPMHVAMPAVEPKGGGLQMRDWSPDGRAVIFNVMNPSAGVGPSLWSYAIDTGEARRVAACGGASWMKDSRRVICGRAAGPNVTGGEVVVVDTSSGVTKETGLKAALGQGVQLAANDTQLFFLVASVAADIWIARFDQPARSQ